MDSNLSLIPDEAAFLLKNQASRSILILADIHLGVEKELSLNGINFPSQTPRIEQRIKELLKKTKAEEILFLGDLQHTIPIKGGEERDRLIREQFFEVRHFLEDLSRHATLHLIPGNHDGGINRAGVEEMVSIHSSKGVRMGKFGFFHGHAWPSNEVAQAEILVMGHVHPLVKLRDRRNFIFQERCWVRTPLKQAFKEKYGIQQVPELFVLPAFNQISGGIAVNEEGMLGPLAAVTDIEHAEIIMLDGVSLGKVKDLKRG
jgi:hypothetical protein